MGYKNADYEKDEAAINYFKFRYKVTCGKEESLLPSFLGLEKHIKTLYSYKSRQGFCFSETARNPGNTQSASKPEEA